MDIKFETSKKGIDPVEYIRDYFSHLSEKEISVLVGSIALLQNVDLKILQGVLDLEQIEVEEKIGRLMQTDLLDGHFTSNQFVLEKFNYKIKKQHPNLTLDDRTLLAYLKARFEVSLEELQEAFDLSYASTIYILSRFVAKGLMTPQLLEDNKYQFIVHFRYKKRGIDEITQFEKELVGYFQLHGKLTITKVSEALEEPEHKILSSLTSLILGDMILAKFEIQSSFLGGVKLLVSLDKFQIYFPQKSIQVLTNEERNFIGYLSLRGTVSLEEISDFLGQSDTEVIKLGSSLHASNQLDIKLENSKFHVVNFRPLSVNRSIDVLSKIHSFNYRIMMGLIQTQQKISIREIANKMETSQNEVVSGLISLYLEGLIDGKLSDKFVFHLHAVKSDDNGKDVTLHRWEKIIMGALISEKVISWPKITALLGIDRSTARNRAFEFISRGISNTVARDTVLVLEEEPNLPQMTQISQLSDIEQQIYGYLKSVRSPQINRITSEFQLTKIETFRIVYFLAGSGLFSLKRDKNKLDVNKVIKVEPQLSISELDLECQEIIKEVETSRQSKISLNDIAKKTGIPKEEVRVRLFEIIAHGFYSGWISRSYFQKSGELYQTMDSGICLYCSKELEPRSTICDHCGRNLPQCGVCKGNLNSNQQLLACPHCKNLSHASHIKQWLNIKGQCPFCRKRIRVKDLLVQQPLL